MTPPEISPEVAEYLGDVQAEAYRTDPRLQSGKCWECGQAADVADEPLSVIVRIQPSSAGGELPVVRLAHARCSGSDVRRITQDELLAHADPDSLDGATEATASAMTWPPGALESGRPVVFMSFGNDVYSLTPTGDRIDIMTSYLLASGWEMATRLGRAPESRPAGWSLRFTTYPGLPPMMAPGRFELVGPGASEDYPDIHTEIDPLQPGGGWTEAAVRTGSVAVYVGPLAVERWTTGPDYPRVQRTAKSGLLTAATIPVTIQEPDVRT